MVVAGILIKLVYSGVYIIAESQSWFMSWLGVLQHQAIVYLSQCWPKSIIIATLGLGLVILYSITYCLCKILGRFTFLFYFDQLASFNQPHVACPAVASIQCPKTTMNTLFLKNMITPHDHMAQLWLYLCMSRSVAAMNDFY